MRSILHMRTRLALYSVTFLAITLVAQAAFAQDGAATLRPGSPISGAISARDPRLSDGRPFRVYRFNADSARHYIIELHSAEFDPYLRIGRMVAGVTDYLLSDDDSGEGRDALIRFGPPSRGSYLVMVTSANDTTASGGTFRLELRELAERPPVVRSIAIGDSAIGSLTDESATWGNTSYPYELYKFQARKGQSLAFRVRADSVRADVEVGSYHNGRFVLLSGSRTSALFRRYTPDADGEYTVKVMAARPARYVLHVDERRPERPRVVAFAQPLTDNLDPKSGDEARPFHDWTFSAREGERLAISLRSSDFDTYLFLNRRQGDSLARVASNDDAPGEGNNSRLSTTVARAGEYVIRVQSADSLGGAYSLRVDTVARVAQHLRRDRIGSGQEARSTLAATDSTLDDGSPYQEWVYHADRPNERVMFTMRSSEFDTFLSVGRMERGKFVEFSSNDDATDESRQNHVSRVLIVAPSAGEFVIRANSMAADQIGAYTLRASDPDVEVRARRMAARADTVARLLRIPDAIALIDSALSMDSSRVTNFELNSVCWFGTLKNFATRVLRYCERAVLLDPSRTGIVDSRGVARALSGNVPGAIQDFRTYAGDTANSAASRDLRLAWAAALQSGTPPAQVFTEAVRTELLKQ